MSLVVVEQAGSNDLQRDTDGKIVASRSFLVYEDTTSAVSLSEVIGAAGLPILGQPHPESGGIIAGSYNIREHPDRAYSYEVTFNYMIPEDVEDDDPDDPLDDSGGGNDGTIDGADPDSAVTAFTIRVGLSIIDIWKSGPNMPSDKSTPARTDIGGTLVSEGGYPISLALPIAEIAINQQRSGFFNAGTYLTKVGKRNSGSWRGFSAGSVLFTGVDVTQDTFGVNEITFQLAFDKYFHLRQVPERDEDGNPKLDLSADPPTMNVFFKQPFKETVDFGFLPY